MIEETSDTAIAEPTDVQIIAALEWSLEWMRIHNVDGLSPFKDYPPVKETIIGMYRAMVAVRAEPATRDTFYSILKNYIPGEVIDQAWQELREAGLVP